MISFALEDFDDCQWFRLSFDPSTNSLTKHFLIFGATCNLKVFNGIFRFPNSHSNTCFYSSGFNTLDFFPQLIVLLSLLSLLKSDHAPLLCTLSISKRARLGPHPLLLRPHPPANYHAHVRFCYYPNALLLQIKRTTTAQAPTTRETATAATALRPLKPLDYALLWLVDELGLTTGFEGRRALTRNQLFVCSECGRSKNECGVSRPLSKTISPSINKPVLSFFSFCLLPCKKNLYVTHLQDLLKHTDWS